MREEAQMAVKLAEHARPEREPSGSPCWAGAGFASLKSRAPILLAGAALAFLAACASSLPPDAPPPIIPGEPGPDGGPPPIPLTGPIAYTCANGAQLIVEANGDQARVAIVGGPSMVLPSAGQNYYSNGRYGFRGGGAAGQWEVGRAAPVNCTGS
jgi:hypothetical protein